jgi:CheY-like chemotaxis protein
MNNNEIFIEDTLCHFKVIQHYLFCHIKLDEEDINELFRAFHSIKASAGFYDLNPVVELIGLGEDILDRVRSKVFIFDEIKQILIDLYGMIKILIDLDIGGNVINDVISTNIIELKKQVNDILEGKNMNSSVYTKILIVDDANLNVELLKLLVEEWFEDNEMLDVLKIDTASDGEIALEKAEQGNYDTIFMDIMMPHMDGISSLKAIRMLDLPKQPIVIMATALMDDKTKQKAKEAGANGYITKPIKYDKIDAILQRYITQSKQEKSSFVDVDKADNIISANEFLQDTNLDYLHDDIDELIYIIETYLYGLKDSNIQEYLDKIIKTISYFRNIVVNFVDFYQLVNIIDEFEDEIQSIDFTILNEDNQQKVFEYIYNSIEEILNWLQTVFIDKTSKDVLSIEKYIISNYMQLKELKKQIK